MSEEVMLSARVPKSLKDLVDVDERSNQQVVKEALRREVGPQNKAELENELERYKRRLDHVQDEKNEIQKKEERIQQRVDALEQQKEEMEEQESQEREVLLDKARRVPANPDHPVIQDVADQLNMTPKEVLEER